MQRRPCPVLHAHEQCIAHGRRYCRSPAGGGERTSPAGRAIHDPPQPSPPPPWTRGPLHSWLPAFMCTARRQAGDGRRQRGSTPAGEKPPRARTIRDSRARASPPLLPAAVPPPPPATVEPRFQARRGDPPSPSRSLSRTHVAATCDAMEEAARWRRRLQRPARSPRLIRDVTERSMNAVAPRAYPHRSPVRVYIKLLSNICNERIHQEKPVSN